MKKHILTISILFGALMFPSCEKTPSAPENAGLQGFLTLSVEGDFNPDSKTASDTEFFGRETAINDIQMVIMDSKGNIELYVPSSDFTINSNVATATKTLTTGVKTVWCLANGPSLEGKTKAEIQEMTVDLTGYSNPLSDFIQFVSGTCSVSTGETATLNVKVKRLVARVSLNVITNQLDSKLDIDKYTIHIANAVKQAEIVSGNGQNVYTNIDGLKGGNPINLDNQSDDLFSTMILYNGKVQYNTTCTVKHRMYSYATPTSPTKEQWLVVSALIGGQWYYYNYKLPALEPNKAYAVEMILKRLGTDTPCVENTTGDLSVTVSVDNWNTGTATEKTF